jgi:hypothetical protein
VAGLCSNGVDCFETSVLSYQSKLRRVSLQKIKAILTNHKLMKRSLIKRFSVKMGIVCIMLFVWPAGYLLDYHTVQSAGIIF